MFTIALRGPATSVSVSVMACVRPSFRGDELIRTAVGEARRGAVGSLRSGTHLVPLG